MELTTLDGSPISVTVYGQPGCRPCRAVKTSLEAKGVDLEYLDVTVIGTEDVQALGFTSTPVTALEADGEVVAAFDGYRPTSLDMVAKGGAINPHSLDRRKTATVVE